MPTDDLALPVMDQFVFSIVVGSDNFTIGTEFGTETLGALVRLMADRGFAVLAVSVEQQVGP